MFYFVLKMILIYVIFKDIAFANILLLHKTMFNYTDAQRFRLTHETSFVKDHLSVWNKIPILFYFACFFRQFWRPICKADYLSMREGFISVHLAPGSKFNFQKYIKRSLQDDFKVIVGIRLR